MSKLLDAIRRVRQAGAWVDPDGDPGPPIAAEGKRILVVYLFRALGDAVLLAPAVEALLRAGAARVDVLVQATPARILKLVDLPWRIHVLPEELDLPPGNPRWRDRAAKEAEAALAAKLSRNEYDVAIELTARADVDARRWIAKSGAEHRLGWLAGAEDAEDAGLTFGTPDVRHQTDRHWSRLLVLPMRCLGVSKPAFDVRFDVSEAASSRAAEHYTSKPRVMIVPGSRQAERRWSPEHFGRIGRWVTAERRGSVVVCGSPDEAPLVREVKKQIGPGAKAFTGKNLGTLLALVAAADAVVTNDTGPMHFAFLMRVPTLAIFTWMSPLVWGPPEKDPRFVVMNAQHPGAADDAEGILARAAIHYLEGLLACAR